MSVTSHRSTQKPRFNAQTRVKMWECCIQPNLRTGSFGLLLFLLPSHHSFPTLPSLFYSFATFHDMMRVSLQVLLTLSWAWAQHNWNVQALVPIERFAFASRSSSSHSSRRIIHMASSNIPTTKPETFPLSLNTFSGQIEAALMERFGSSASRVIESLRLLEMEYEHVEFVGNQQTPPITNKETSQCYQRAHSFVPGLPARQFYDTSRLEWAQRLLEDYPKIKSEFVRVTANVPKLAREGNNIWAGALTADASSYGTGWRTLVLMDRGTWDATNVHCFPKTARAIRDSGAPVVEAFFASMEPHSDIQLHTDNTNFVVTSHLALDIPNSGENKCRLTIGDETRQWISGEICMFDTSILHSAINESDKTRYILMLRLWHPDLTKVERQAIQFLYDALQIPELISIHPEERLSAEQYVETTMRAFPEIKPLAAESFGFGAKKMETKKKKKR